MFPTCQNHNSSGVETIILLGVGIIIPLSTRAISTDIRRGHSLKRTHHPLPGWGVSKKKFFFEFFFDFFFNIFFILFFYPAFWLVERVALWSPLIGWEGDVVTGLPVAPNMFWLLEGKFDWIILLLRIYIYIYHYVGFSCNNGTVDIPG